MIFYLQEIFKSLIGNIIPPSSTMEALRLFIPISKRQEFKIKSFDQRKIFEVASVLLKEDINSLVAKVGKIIGVPPLIRLPNIHNLEDSYINQFLQCGAAPVILNENIIGIACVEPGLAKELRRNFGNPPLYVVSWSTIKDAIREATKQQDLQPGIYRDLLVDLLQEAKKLNSQGLRIQFQQQKVLYSFIGLKNIEEGELSETVSEPLKEILTTSKHGAFMLAGFTCNVVEEKDKNIFIVKFHISSYTYQSTTINLPPNFCPL